MFTCSLLREWNYAILLAVSILSSQVVIAQEIWVRDTCFGTNGSTITDLGYVWEPGMWIDVQQDGKIIGAAATSTNEVPDFAVLRYDTNGFLDSTFGVNGVFRLSGGTAQSVKIQPDQKIIVSGQFGGFPISTSFALLRLNQDGTLDSSFGAQGAVATSLGFYDYRAIEAIVQPDGKIVQCGRLLMSGVSHFTLVRFDSDGSIDSTFGINGMVIEEQPASGEASNLKLQDDGKLVIAGRLFTGENMDYVLKRYNTDGSVDSSFGNNGTVLTDIGNDDDHASSLYILSNGKILITGRSDYFYPDRDFRLLQYHSDGTLDLTFGNNGLASADFGFDEISYCLVPLSNGKILVCGSVYGSDNNYKVGIARFNADGSLDATFCNDGLLLTSISERDDYFMFVKEQADGRVLLSGMSDMGQTTSNMDITISRYTLNSCEGTSIDELRKTCYLHIYPNPASDVVEIKVDGLMPTGIIITISNSIGQCVLSTFRSSDKPTIDISKFANGIYSLSVFDGHTIISQKLVVSN